MNYHFTEIFRRSCWNFCCIFRIQGAPSSNISTETCYLEASNS